MKVILINDVKGLGKEGDMVNVKTGYARNFLFPAKSAVEATEENVANWKKMKAEQKAKQDGEIAQAEELKAKLEGITLNIQAKTGQGDRLFGSITSMDIAEVLKKQEGIDIDKKKIELKENIKSLATFNVPVRLYPEIVANLKVVVSKA